MKSTQKSYRQIIKVTSILGGVQVIQIVVQIVRSKAIAMLLGPTGMGINNLLNSTILLINSLTSFGLKTSAVKSVSEANGTQDLKRVATIVKVLQRWVWVTGLLGTILTLIFSGWLSQITFGNRDYTHAFSYISISLLFNQLSTGQLVILQSLRKIKHLARANLTGAVFGLIIALPLYYFWGLKGIVPAIVCISIANMFFSWYYANKVHVAKICVSRHTTFHEGKDMLTMGFILSLSSFMNLGTAYLLRIFINYEGGLEDVGLYSAGFAIINSYVGLVFTSMGTDYLPRLCSTASDNKKASQTINQQAEITILILAPILVIFMVLIKWVVILLYSTKFAPIQGMIQWAALGMFFKAASWSIAFIFLAKGASKLFFWNELITNIYLLFMNLVGYKYGGLDGLGISFLCAYVIYFFQVLFITKSKYLFSFDKSFTLIFGLQFTLALICFLTVNFISVPFRYILSSIVLAISLLYSLREMKKKLGLKSLLKQTH